MRLELQATWSQRYTGALPFELPAGWQLATHQQETYDALHDPDVDVVFDLAMTGDGKTLAAFLPMLRPHSPALGRAAFAYPTNELIRDQARQLEGYMHSFAARLESQQVHSREIDRMVALNDEASRYVALKDLMYQRDVLLTNPDIFNLIQRFAYTTRYNPATLAEQFSNRFRYLVFDEFHIFSAVQIASILDAMLFIRAGNNPRQPSKFLFLSATPSTLLLDALDKAGLRYCIVQGRYSDAPSKTHHYRKILQATSLEIVASEANTGGIMRWVEDKLERIISFFQQYPGSKGLILCNSVFTAKKLHAYLQTALAKTAIRLGENTGLTGLELRRTSLEQDLIVATSTVDVGVDFRINFLLFESLNAGSFVQRLGRLGRHEGFASYQAIALLPQFITERFAQRYLDGQVLQRWDLFREVSSSTEDSSKDIFPREQNFAHYIARWGSIQAVQRIHALSQVRVRDKHAALLQAYHPKAAQVFDITKHTLVRKRNMGAAVYRELQSFRGAGLLDVWLYEPVSQQISAMNIFNLLAGAAFRLVTKEEAQRIAQRLEQPFYAPYLELYAVLEGYYDAYDHVNLRYLHRFDNEDLPFNHAVDRVGFQLEARHVAIGKINDALLRRALCSCVCDRELSGETPRSVRQRLRLPPLFQLANVVDDGGANYTVAFGQDALLLDSCIHWRKTQDYDFC